MSNAQKKSKRSWWLQPFRLTLLEEQSFSERWQISVTRWGTLVTLMLLVVTISSLTYAVVAWTPLRESVVPGYVSEASRQQAISLEFRADSALNVLEQNQRYLAVLNVLLQGEVLDEPGELDRLLEEAVDTSAVTLQDWELPVEDVSLRNLVEEEDRFVLQRGQSEVDPNRSIPYPPIQGTISSSFDAASGHYGVDFVAPEGSIIHAVDDGVVVIASYTSDGGYVVSIQHEENRLSVYKHNKSLLVESGDRVIVGDPIAVLGSTGAHSTGPHSHFEWWVDGQPLDPANWLPNSPVSINP
ncbi:MAG: M23 family metallopeptidase [Bacteroidetes bacterium]|nr:M23 family metallopeptidase [Bacteroidota bacterium]